MSIHHLECAAALELPATTKLVLLAFADSADKQTRVAFPGLTNLMKWSGLKKSAALAAARTLVDRGLIARLSASRPGRRAEYLVFPNGCCPKHGSLADHSTGRPNRAGNRPPGGSTTADPSTPERVQPPGPEWVQPCTPTGPAEEPNGSSSCRTPSLRNSAGTSTPQPPAAVEPTPATPWTGAPPAKAVPAARAPAKAQVCPRHRDEPHPACRGCGTNTRSTRAEVRREAERRPLVEIHAHHASGCIMPTEARPPEIVELFDRVRQTLRHARYTGSLGSSALSGASRVP